MLSKFVQRSSSSSSPYRYYHLSQRRLQQRHHTLDDVMRTFSAFASSATRGTIRTAPSSFTPPAITTTTATFFNDKNEWRSRLPSLSSPSSFTVRHFASQSPPPPPGNNNNNNGNGMQLPPWMTGYQQAKPGEYLQSYTTNLTQLAAEGKLDPIIGRHEEIRRCLQILARRTKNSKWFAPQKTKEKKRTNTF